MVTRRASISFLVAALMIFPAAAARRPDSARVYVTITDKGGKPIPNLTAADFHVREDGTDKVIASAAPATTPIAVALLTDHFGAGGNFSVLDVRAALDGIVRRLHRAEEIQISLTSIDPAPIPLVKFTPDLVPLRQAINLLSPGTNQGVLLEAVAQVCGTFDPEKTDRRIVFAVVASYKPDSSAIESGLVGARLRDAGASFWALEGRPSTGALAVNKGRDDLLNVGTALSGGARLQVALGSALETQGTRLADLILSQYAVTYNAPRAGAERLEISVGVKDAKVLAPGWARRF